MWVNSGSLATAIVVLGLSERLLTRQRGRCLNMLTLSMACPSKCVLLDLVYLVYLLEWFGFLALPLAHRISS